MLSRLAIVIFLSVSALTLTGAVVCLETGDADCVGSTQSVS